MLYSQQLGAHMRTTGNYPYKTRAEELRAMADQLDAEGASNGFAAAALREYAALHQAGLPQSLIDSVADEAPKAN